MIFSILNEDLYTIKIRNTTEKPNGAKKCWVKKSLTMHLQNQIGMISKYMCSCNLTNSTIHLEKNGSIQLLIF